MLKTIGYSLEYVFACYARQGIILKLPYIYAMLSFKFYPGIWFFRICFYIFILLVFSNGLL
jgi:hypothetical protein